MSIAIDSRNAGAKSAGATSISWTHTVGAALVSGFLHVGASTGSGTAVSISAVVWDSGGANTGLSKTVNAVDTELTDTANNLKTSWWWLAPPAAGAKTILVTAASSCELEAGSSSWSGCAGTFNAASPQKTNRGANTNPTTTVTSAVGEQVIDVIGVNLGSGVTAVEGASQTLIFNQNNGPATSIGAGSDEASTGATVTMDWTGMTVNTNDTNQICVSLIPAVAAAPATARRSSRPFPFRPGSPRSR